MRTFPDLRMRQIVWDTHRAQKCLDDGEYEQARDLFLELRARARKLGVESAHVAWAIAVAYDNLGELEMAFTTITEAVNQDPLNPGGHRSFDIITSHMRAALADENRAPDDPSTPRLYEMLVGAGEADVPSHLAMARHLAHTGKHAEAMKMLNAVTLLSPVSRDAWLQKASLARTIGNAELAMQCEAEAAAISTTAIPFGVPPPVGRAC